MVTANEDRSERDDGRGPRRIGMIRTGRLPAQNADASESTQSALRSPSAPRSRLEIAHESLLSQWPRLVRWRAQDEEGAVLRDQLRQATQVWEQHGRSEDFLWTGTAFREYRLWRERYPGGLTDGEEAFAAGMESLASRRKRRARTAAAGTICLLLTVIAVIGVLWSESERSRSLAEEQSRRAETQARRAEASKLLALGQLEAEGDPTAALAYATRSLETFDTVESRLFALRLLQRGPVARLLQAVPGDGFDTWNAAFSPDGRWLAFGGRRGAQIWSRSGGAGRVLGSPRAENGSLVELSFPSVDILLELFQGRLTAFVPATGEELWTVEAGEPATALVQARGGPVTLSIIGDQIVLRQWSLDSRDSRVIGRMSRPRLVAVDPEGGSLAYTSGRWLFVRSLRDRSQVPHRVGLEAAQIRDFAWHPDGTRIAVLDTEGNVRVHSASWTAPNEEEREHPGLGVGLSLVTYDPSGRWLAIGGKVDGPLVRLQATRFPDGSRPIELRSKQFNWLTDLDFSPDGAWLATSHLGHAALWAIPRRNPVVLDGHSSFVTGLAFSHDGRTLFSVSNDGTVRAWPVAAGGASGVVFEGRSGAFPQIDLDPTGKLLAVVGNKGFVSLVPVGGGPPRRLEGFSEEAWVDAVRFSPDGRMLAAGAMRGAAADKGIHIWNLETGASRVEALPAVHRGFFFDAVWSLDFLPDGRLVAAIGREGGGPENEIVVVDPSDGSVDSVAKGFLTLRLRADGKRLVAAGTSVAGDVRTFEVAAIDLESRRVRRIPQFGSGCYALGLDRHGTVLVSGSIDGTLRIGPLEGGEPHLLLGHSGLVRAVAISPDGRWVASAGEDRTVRLWPVPDRSRAPFHRLPHQELIERLKTLTNLRVVEDESSSTGYGLEIGPFPGWADVPEW